MVAGTELYTGFGEDHGTAVNGILHGLDNGWGVKGIAHGSTPWFAGAFNNGGSYNIANSIVLSASVLATGDVLLIEQQLAGPNGGQKYVPVEWYQPTYDAIVTAVGNGIIVLEAAGNGGENLDAPEFSTGNSGHYPFLPENDSGAIIVGAGNSPNIGTPRLPSSFSTYGSTVDLQGWGDSVMTTGYGAFYNAEGAHMEFTAGFSGTSSATPIVAGAAALAQAAWTGRYGTPGTPQEIRDLLVNTGTPQAGTDHIGPLPNLRAAILAIMPEGDVDGDGLPDDWEVSWFGSVTNSTGGSDSDGDGRTDREEWISGTEPNNSNSVFRAESMDGDRQVGVQTVTGRVYTLYATEDLVSPDWQAVPGKTNIPGTGGLLQFQGATGFSRRLFRVGVEE